jgi:hypothetical protein
LSTAQAGARGVRDVALTHYPSCTEEHGKLIFLRNMFRLSFVSYKNDVVKFQEFVLSKKTAAHYDKY